MTAAPSNRCHYCRSRTACRGSAWTSSGGDVASYERAHTPERRAALAEARMAAVEQWCDRNGVVMKDFPDELIEQAIAEGDTSVLHEWLATLD